MKTTLYSLLALFACSTLSAQTSDLAIRQSLLGAAYLDNQSYDLLEEMTDRFGPRLTGSKSNEQSLELLKAALEKEGISTRKEVFTFPGWERKNDTAILLEPIKRKLRAIAMGYVDKHPTFDAEVIYIGKNKPDELPADSQGKIGLLAANVKLTEEQINELATTHGIKGLLLTNRKNGGQLLARTINYTGDAAVIPAYSITEEEGLWLKRLIQRGGTPRIQLTTRSKVKQIKTANLVATIPGKVPAKIVVGAHFDSWDLGQGALDNGLGVAQGFDIARLLNSINPNNHYTIEVVWFNAEEFGLFGSNAYMETHRDDDIVAMINLDMVGTPIGANAMGFDSLVPFLDQFSENLKGLKLSKATTNKPWLGSDHMPFIVNGIPSITLNAPIKAESVKFYHDFGDTFEKVDREELAKSIGILTLLTYELANNPSLNIPRLSEQETIELLRKAKLEEKMKRYKLWPFEDSKAEN